MGEFTLRPQQEAVRAVFVPIARLQRDLDLAGRANVLLLSARSDGADAAAAERLLNAVATFEDLGLRLVPAEAQHAWVLESETGLLSDSLFATARNQARRLGFVELCGLDVPRQHDSDWRALSSVLGRRGSRPEVVRRRGPVRGAATGEAQPPPPPLLR